MALHVLRAAPLARHGDPLTQLGHQLCHALQIGLVRGAVLVDQRFDLRHVAGAPSAGAGRSSRRASGTSTVAASRNCAYVLPCASSSSDSVPPPPRLRWRRKFTASRLGSSNRSTSP